MFAFVNYISYICNKLFHMGEKKCSKCSEIKLIEDFYLNYGKPRSQCKKCINEYKNNLRILNPDYKSLERKRHYQKYKNDPIYALSKRLRQRIYHVLRHFKSKRTLEILGCNWEEFKIHIESQFTEGMTWDNLSEIHIDHIIPISSAETIEDVYKLNHYTNLQPLWAKDNLEKYNKIINL